MWGSLVAKIHYSDRMAAVLILAIPNSPKSSAAALINQDALVVAISRLSN